MAENNYIRESYLYQILCAFWTRLKDLYHQSAVCTGCLFILSWLGDRTRESVIMSFFNQDGVFASAWKDSLLCRALTWAFNLPARVLNLWYQAWRATFDDSFFARLIFQFGHETAIAESWLIMALWVIPYAAWNNAYSLAAFLFLLLLFYAGAMRRENFKIHLESIGFYPTAFFILIFIAAAWSYQSNLSWRFLIYHISAALCVIVTVSAARNAYDLKRLCGGALFVTAVSSGYAFFQRVHGVAINRAYVDLNLNPDMPGRVDSFYDNPNTFGAVLVMLLPLTLALALCAKKLIIRLLAWCVWLAGVIALVMTYSRAGYVGFALSVMIIILLLKPDLMPVLIALCVIAIPFLPSAVWTRILTIVNFSDTTTSSRFPLYQTALRVIRRSPITGAGLGVDAVQKYVKDYNLYRGAAVFIHSHNLYLQIWLETGLFGLVILLAALFRNVKNGLQAVRDNLTAYPARGMTCAATAGLCGVALCGMSDYIWHYPRVMCIFWFVFAMTLAGVKIYKSN